MSDVIDDDTYKKWYKVYSKEKALIMEAMTKAQAGVNHNRWIRLEKLLPILTDMKTVYN